MAALPKVGIPHPADNAAMREFMRPRVMPFIETTDEGDPKPWIHIIDPTLIETATDIKAGTMTVINDGRVWSGYARIQPIRNTVNSWRATNPTTTRIVQFWVEFPDEQEIDLRPGLRIAVEFGGNDPWLTEYQYVVVGALNSSQAWQRTIDTQVDLENRPDYDMTDWPKPPPIGA